MQKLQELILNSEDWLISRILNYAKERGYVKYTSTLAEALRLSISCLSESILTALKFYNEPPELGPDDDYTKDPITSFGILEAQRHRSRGITIGMFLGLLKYYRQSYIDLIKDTEFDVLEKDRYRLFIERSFDRIEIGFCTEWTNLSGQEKIEELQSTNRFITNEKNKYLTCFESLKNPVILLDREGQVINI